MESVEELGSLKEGQSYDVCDSKTRKVVQGKVFLALAASVLIVKVHRISGFTDNAGWMDSSSYWTVYKIFASQSQHKYKIIIFFSGDVNDEANFSFFILLHKRAKPMLPPCVHFSNHKLIITLCSPLVTIFHIQICYQLLQTRPTGEKRYQLLQTAHTFTLRSARGAEGYRACPGRAG